ncbi:MAG TPA: hypothetical protein PKM25_06505 [Candidatus Ozemobacteraceae bacterium]|nr:hypothetical protein [Candidatus Ozemobacteraceae bacterium]
MWIAVQILMCVTIILAVCFIAGKRIGQRRFLKMQDEMKTLEKAFNQLLEQMELVSGHNLKVLDTKTQELRELLTVADKKCLYANDLMKEVEEMKRQLQNHNRTAGATALPAPVNEIKLRREVQELLDGTNEQVHAIETRIFQLEQDQLELLQQIVSLKQVKASPERLLDEPPQPVYPAEEPPAYAAPALEQPPAQHTAEPHIPSAQDTPFGDAAVLDRLKNRSRASHFGLDSMQVEIVQQVLDLHDQGVSIPQIARQMKMSKSEVELMMKLYAMRKAV